jgi:hypothetical protein
MTMFRRNSARKWAGLAAGLALVALAATTAYAATMSSTIWTYYDSHGHILGNAGLNCDGDVFDYEGDFPDGGYVRRSTHACNNGLGASSVTCFFVSDGPTGPSLHSISCTQMPGFGSY